MAELNAEAAKILQDPQMQRYIQMETERAKFHQAVSSLTSDCFDKCVDYPSQKLGSRVETCISNCVERIIDTNNFIMNRVGKMPEQSEGTSEDLY